jgi:hypothetical protein
MRLRALSAAMMAVVALLLVTEQAEASYDPIAGGATRLTLAPSFAKALKSNGVRLAGQAGATVAGRLVTFPVAGGKLDPVEVKGAIEHSGSLLFSAGNRKLPLRALQLKTTRRSSPYAAKFGGGQLKLGPAAKLSSKRSGFGTTVTAAAIRLSAKVATRLDKKLGLRGVFSAGDPFATAVTEAQPSSLAIAPVGKAELTLDPALAAKLQSLFASVSPVFPAERPGAFTLPIAGGTLAPDASSGTLKLTGALEFIEIGGGQFFIRELEPDFSVHLANAESQLVLAAGGSGPNAVSPLLGLSGGLVTSEPTARTIAVAGAELSMAPAIAQAFNEAFARPQGKANVFSAGEPLGSLSFVAHAQ